jgi:hypothetical protein
MYYILRWKRGWSMEDGTWGRGRVRSGEDIAYKVLELPKLT